MSQREASEQSVRNLRAPAVQSLQTAAKETTDQKLVRSAADVSPEVPCGDVAPGATLSTDLGENLSSPKARFLLLQERALALSGTFV